MKHVREQHSTRITPLSGILVLEHNYDMSVLFSDIVGFTEYSSTCSAEAIVNMLNVHFTTFDNLCLKYRLEKVKTIGCVYICNNKFSDAYFCVGTRKTHKTDIILMGMAMQSSIAELNAKHCWSFAVRIGIACGEGYLSVLGDKKLTFDCFGAVVVEAHKLEANGEPGKVNVSKQLATATSNMFAFSENISGTGCTVDTILDSKVHELYLYLPRNSLRLSAPNESLRTLVSGIRKKANESDSGNLLRYFKWILQFKHFATCKEYIFHDFEFFVVSYRMLMLMQCLLVLWCYGLFIYENVSILLTSLMPLFIAFTCLQVLLLVPALLYMLPCVSRWKVSSYSLAVYSTSCVFAMTVMSIFFPSRRDFPVFLTQGILLIVQ